LLFGAPKIRLLGQARRKQGKEVGKREQEREREKNIPLWWNGEGFLRSLKGLTIKEKEEERP